MKLKLVLLSFLLSFVMKAQPPGKFYGKYGGDGDDIGYSAKPSLDGQYIIAGSSSSYGTHGGTDVYLMKLDSMGFPMWQKFYGGSGNEVGKSVILLPDSGFVIAGFTNSFGAGGYDAYVIRTDKLGNMIWQKTFGGLDWDFATDLVLASDGNIFVVGNTVSFGNGKKDGFVLKYDLSGNQLLQKFIGGSENEELNSIIKTNDNFLATVGYTESRGEINGDGYFLKLDLNADTIFTKTFGGPYRDYASDLVQKASSDFVIAGAKTFVLNYTESLMYTITSTGNFLAERNVSKNNQDESFASVANSSLLPYITAFTRSIVFPVNKRQGQLFSMYPNGFEYQVNESGGLEDEYEYSIEATKNGGYISVGSTRSFGSLGLDIYFIKRDSVGLFYSSVVNTPKYIQELKPLFVQYDNLLTFNFREQKGELIQIINIDGKIISTYLVNENSPQINITNYTPSIYLVKIKFNHGQCVYYKLIKN